MDVEHTNTKPCNSHLTEANRQSRGGSHTLWLPEVSSTGCFFGHTSPSTYILPPAATQKAGMAEHILPHPKSTDPNLDPKASSSTVTSSPRFCLKCLRRAFSPFFLDLSGLRRLGKLSSRGSKPPHHFLLILTLFSHSSVLKQETQATVFTNLSSSPCP